MPEQFGGTLSDSVNDVTWSSETLKLMGASCDVVPLQSPTNSVASGGGGACGAIGDVGLAHEAAHTRSHGARLVTTTARKRLMANGVAGEAGSIARRRARGRLAFGTQSLFWLHEDGSVEAQAGEKFTHRL